MKPFKLIGRILTAIVLLIGLAFVGLVIYAKYFYSSEEKIESHYMSELPLSPDRFAEDFAEISGIVKENYSLYESKHIDIDALSASYAERIGKLSTAEEYGKALLEYFASLQSGHAFVCLNEYRAGTFAVT